MNLIKPWNENYLPMVNKIETEASPAEYISRSHSSNKLRIYLQNRLIRLLIPQIVPSLLTFIKFIVLALATILGLLTFEKMWLPHLLLFTFKTITFLNIYFFVFTAFWFDWLIETKKIYHQKDGSLWLSLVNLCNYLFKLCF